MLGEKRMRTIEEEGHYAGTQGVKPDSALDEIAALFEQRKKSVHDEAVEGIKSLEAKIATLDQRKPDAEKHWRVLETQTNGLAPEIGLPFVAIMVASLAVGGEIILLAPVMDGFGISDASWQSFTAGVLVLVSSGLLELTLRHARSSSAESSGRKNDESRPANENRTGWLKVVFTFLLTTLAFTLVFVLGWWRAEEMIFAGSLQQGEWKNFLSQNPTLTRFCVILLTVGLPIFTAVALRWGFDRLRFAWEWRKACRVFLGCCKALDEAGKLLEAITERRDTKTAALDCNKDEWTSAYLQNYAHGHAIGAHKQPFWLVGIKIGAVTLLILLACLFFDPVLGFLGFAGWLRAFILGCTTLGLSGAYAYHSIKGWQRPTPRQLLKQRSTIWRSGQASEAPHPVLLRNGSNPTPGLTIASRPILESEVNSQHTY